MVFPVQPINPFTESEHTAAPNDQYDPCFVLPLLSHLLDTGIVHYIHPFLSYRCIDVLSSFLPHSTGSVVDCHQFISSGCLGYLMTSLSSLQESVRQAGCHGLSSFCEHLKGTRFREKTQVSSHEEVI